MKGWIIKDRKNSKFDEQFAMAKAYGVDVVYLYDIQIEVDPLNDMRIYVAGAYQEKPDFVYCFFEGIVEDATDMSYHLYVLEQLNMLGVFCFHKAEDLVNTCDKLKCYQLLRKAGIPVPHTIMLTEHTPLDWVSETLGFPMVVKVENGSKGRGVCLVRDAKELKNISELYCDKGRTLLAQEFIATSKGRDMRVTLCNNELIFALIRDNSKNSDFRSNVSQGGEALMVRPPKEAMDMAVKAAQALGLCYCGVDLLYGPEGFIVGEINSMPGILDEMFEGENCRDLMFKKILKTVNLKCGEV